MFKELEEKGGNSRSDANKEVDNYEEHVSCTGNLEPEGCWIHDGGNRPPEREDHHHIGSRQKKVI